MATKKIYLTNLKKKRFCNVLGREYIGSKKIRTIGQAVRPVEALKTDRQTDKWWQNERERDYFSKLQVQTADDWWWQNDADKITADDDNITTDDDKMRADDDNITVNDEELIADDAMMRATDVIGPNAHEKLTKREIRSSSSRFKHCSESLI